MIARSLFAMIASISFIATAKADTLLSYKANELIQNCGSRVISSFRPHARVRGSRRMSLHAVGKAIDVQGNPACIYSHLHGWRGGYSIDYGKVHHVHISLGGREDGLRFKHRR
jgi:hypothetical protein